MQLGGLAIKAFLPSLLSQIEGGVLEDYLIKLRYDFCKDLCDDETVEILQTMEKNNGIDVAMIHIVALDECRCVRVLKSYTVQQLLELIKTKL